MASHTLFLVLIYLCAGRDFRSDKTKIKVNLMHACILLTINIKSPRKLHKKYYDIL